MPILFSFLDNRKVWGIFKDNFALTILLDQGILHSIAMTFTFYYLIFPVNDQGPVVQSMVSLTSSLRG